MSKLSRTPTPITTPTELHPLDAAVLQAITGGTCAGGDCGDGGAAAGGGAACAGAGRVWRTPLRTAGRFLFTRRA